MPAILFVLVAFGIMTVQLFTHPIISIADNTDFRRISAQVGIVQPYTYPQGFFEYAHTRFPFGKPEQIEYASSELVFCKIAKILNRTFYSREIFDIRFLGMIHACSYAASLFFFASVLCLRPMAKSIFLALMLFVLLDDRIISYFNTFYSESSSMIFLLLTVGLMLTFYPEKSTRPTTFIKLFSLVGASLLLSYSKTQNLILLFPLWCFVVCITWEKLKFRNDRYAWAVGSALLMLGGVFFGIESRAFAATKNTNIRVVLNEEIRPHSPDFANDLRQLHATKKDISRVTLLRISLFYARHPLRYLDLLERRAGKAFQHIPYGSYTEENSHSPLEQSSKFNYWWRFKAKYFPRHLWFIFGTLTLASIFGIYNYFRAPRQFQSHIGLISTTLSFMAATAFIIASTFEANGPEKHLFMFNVLFDYVVAFSFLSLIYYVRPLRPYFHCYDRKRMVEQLGAGYSAQSALSPDP